MKQLLSNKRKSQILKIFWITVAWIIIAGFQFLISYSLVRLLKCDFGDLRPIYFLKGALLTGLLAGIIGGTALVFVWEKWLRIKKYGTALFNMFWSYCIIFVLVAIPTGLYFHSQGLGLPFYDPKVIETMTMHLFGLDQLLNFVIWLSIVLITLIALQVNDKYGPGVFRSFLLGKYFHAKREERIFMFLDLRSSTTIAEKLGEERYFHFIKNVFKDVTPAILNARGEIYQYVGDEIVISWPMNTGIKDSNCLQCFFEIQLALSRQNSFYKENYDGLQPEFKAGLHYGFVMAGEVGVVKRDIAYSGDVLNTTARIQSMCNELGVNVLLSQFLLDKLALRPHLFNTKRVGEMLLRGKEQKVTLYTV